MTPDRPPLAPNRSKTGSPLTWALGFALILSSIALSGCGRSDSPSGAQAPPGPAGSAEDAFFSFSNTGRNFYERGEADRAVTNFQQAARLQPGNADARINLANALLLGNRSQEAIAEAEAALAADPHQAAALYILGCAHLRLGKAEPAVKALQSAKDIDRTINEVSFQLGRAHQMLGNHEAAIAEFEEVIRFGPQHPAAHYALSQSLLRANRKEDADKALAEHQKIHAGRPPQITDPALFERSKHTQARVPFRQAPPDAQGVAVRFTDASAQTLGASASSLRGPVAVADIGGARNSLLLREADGSFRVLTNSSGVFTPHGPSLPARSGARYHKALVGDLNNDKAEDVLMLSDSGATAFRITTNGAVTDATAFANLKFLSATNGVLVDYLFTGNLGLAAIGHGQENVRFLRNLGSMYFSTNATNIGIPLDLSGCRQVVADDWNGDDLIDLVLQRDAAPPLILLKQSGGPLVATNPPPGAKPSIALVTGDFNNDLRNDLALLDAGAITVVYGGSEDPRSIPLGPDRGATGICAVDYDNDGWLDLITLGAKPQIWRNRWQQGFLETTEATGLASIGSVRELSAFDADNDGDIDMLVTRPDQSLALFKNEGGNVNQLLKVRLVGNRSNASGIGVKMEIFSGSTRLSRRVLTLPTEIGVGNLKQIDSINTRWFTLSLNTVDVKVDPTNPVRLDELVIADTSCPYVYVWDGSKFRFVTDILGAAPIGLPIAEGRYIEADADEFVWLGDEATVQPKDGRYRLSITEELREVLFLDEAKLVVVDHAPGTEVHTTDKLLPSGPFPPSQLVTLENRRPLLRAERLDGSDATGELLEIDGRKASPHRLREPQLRGLAEPHGVVLDFGPLPAGKPLVLSLTGWLRFGGGMANMAASIRPDLPFPFPILEYETGSGAWRPLNIQPGAPIGKTKTILVDLGDKLPPDAKRLRLSTAFEIHWDRIALWEKRQANDSRITQIKAGSTQLRWRGYGVLEDTPWHEPQRPMYETVQANPPWRVSPGGWATRYGSVDELVNERDNALAIINGGDELLLDFPAAEVPVKPSSHQRTFFLYSVGWEKDGDYHVAGRYSFEPLPWHGMNDQMHGKETRPAFENDGWIKKYNTRWCSPQILTRLPASSQ